jgi:cell fate (sporulation/competence/biofilm development) regulator YlbF (YheA/YmcA/DUF963 family)
MHRCRLRRKEETDMSDVVELSKKLNETIKESEFYRNYLTCRERLYEHPDLLRGLNEFKKRNSEIQNRGSVDNPYDEVVALFEEYDAIVHDTIVNDFLRAERKLCRMLKTMYDEIADGLDVDIKQ